MTAPEVKQGSETQDLSEASEPRARDWFQPPRLFPAADDPQAATEDARTDIHGSTTGVSAAPAEGNGRPADDDAQPAIGAPPDAAGDVQAAAGDEADPEAATAGSPAAVTQGAAERPDDLAATADGESAESGGPAESGGQEDADPEPETETVSLPIRTFFLQAGARKPRTAGDADGVPSAKAAASGVGDVTRPAVGAPLDEAGDAQAAAGDEAASEAETAGSAAAVAQGAPEGPGDRAANADGGPAESGGQQKVAAPEPETMSIPIRRVFLKAEAGKPRTADGRDSPPADGHDPEPEPAEPGGQQEAADPEPETMSIPIRTVFLKAGVREPGPDTGRTQTAARVVPADVAAPPATAGRRQAAAGSPAVADTSAPAPEAATPKAARKKTRASRSADKSAKKASRSVFGEVAAVRPDVLTDAETVVMSTLDDKRRATSSSKSTTGSASSPQPRAGRKESGPRAAAAASVSASAEAVTQIFSAVRGPAQEAAPHAAWPYQPELVSKRYVPTRRQTRVSRLLLLGVLVLQAILSLRLRNTAFEDEALYLYSGHMELEHMLHNAALYGNFSSYFSGAPVLYPVAAAALNNLGGIAAARALSLAEMLATTTMLYSIARYIFNERAGLCAAALFAVSESAIFLGNFATYDATCLFLLAAAAWIMVFTARSKWPLFMLAAPVAALAVAVKYAGLLWVPTIAVLPPLVAWPYRNHRAWVYTVGFAAEVAALLYGALRLGGRTYLAALQSTTTHRAQGATPVATLLREGAEWGGLIFVLAIVGTIAYVWRVRTEPDERIAPAGGRLRRALLGLVLTGTALLAPLYQAHLHTDISFQKHIGFGLFFAAPMAGFGLARLMGDYFRRPHIGIGLWSLGLVLGMVQSGLLYQEWPSSAGLTAAFATHLKPQANYLVEAPEAVIYYLQGRSDAQPKQFTSTYSVAPLTSPANFAAAVKNGQFQVIAYDGDVTPANDQALATALAADKSYYLASKVYIGVSFGAGQYYYIWVKGQKPLTGVSNPPLTPGSTAANSYTR
jgi:Dolichyl-phosphate-mannose-protein mannosyltransferase